MKIMDLIKKHPIWTIWIVTLILYAINALSTGNPNPAGYFCIGLFLMALFAPLIRRARRKKERTEDMDYLAKKIAEEQQNNTIEYRNCYQKKLLLTKNEWFEYHKLKQLAEKNGLQVFPKVRLLDLIEPRNGDPRYKTLFNKIQAKHVDFVICDQSAFVKAIIELDDNSHNKADRKKRDDFVDLILKDVGYTVIRTRSITEETLAAIA